MPKSRVQYCSLRRCAPQRPIAKLKLLFIVVLCSRTVCLSNKGLGLHRVSSVITILVLLSAAVVRIGVNCARLFARLLLFHWNNIYTLLLSHTEILKLNEFFFKRTTLYLIFISPETNKKKTIKFNSKQEKIHQFHIE